VVDSLDKAKGRASTSTSGHLSISTCLQLARPRKTQNWEIPVRSSHRSHSSSGSSSHPNSNFMSFWFCEIAGEGLTDC